MKRMAISSDEMYPVYYIRPAIKQDEDWGVVAEIPDELVAVYETVMKDMSALQTALAPYYEKGLA